MSMRPLSGVLSVGLAFLLASAGAAPTPGLFHGDPVANLPASNLAPPLPWDGCGHKVVAALAFDRLQPATKKAVEAIFKADRRDRKFIDAATWPDDIKQGNRNSPPPKAPVNKPWHYVDIPYDADEDEIQQVLTNDGKEVDPKVANSANAVTAI